MIGIRLLCLIAIAWSLPRAWQEIKGVGPRQIAKIVLHDREPEGKMLPAATSFDYWGKGSQSYVFLSRDGQTILKVLRASKMGESFANRVIKRKPERTTWLKSFRIARDFLADRTALLYLQAEPTRFVSGSIALYDRLNRPLQIDLQNVAFILQRKNELLSEKLQRAICEGNRDLAEQLLSDFLDLIGDERARGFSCLDSAFELNFGYENGRATRIDIGTYVPLEDSLPWQKSTRPVRRWLASRDPQLSVWFEAQVAKRERP